MRTVSAVSAVSTPHAAVRLDGSCAVRVSGGGLLDGKALSNLGNKVPVRRYGIAR